VGFTTWRCGRSASHGRAIEDAQKAIQINPSEDESLYILGRMYLMKNETKKAIGYLTAYLDKTPLDADAHEYRGIAYSKSGELREAMLDFSVSEKLAPNNPGPYYSRGRALFEVGRMDEALTDLLKSMQLGIPEMDVHYMAALCLMKSGDYGAAITNLDLYLESVGPDPKGLEARALAYEKTGKSSKAVKDVTRARHNKNPRKS
jgi:tetratricopeptide (TPR) repeat protein